MCCNLFHCMEVKVEIAMYMSMFHLQNSEEN
jgi:hypothetical protein